MRGPARHDAATGGGRRCCAVTSEDRCCGQRLEVATHSCNGGMKKAAIGELFSATGDDKAVSVDGGGSGWLVRQLAPGRACATRYEEVAAIVSRGIFSYGGGRRG